VIVDIMFYYRSIRDQSVKLSKIEPDFLRFSPAKFSRKTLKFWDSF